MNRPIAEEDLADKPLDPAVERVRAKLVRFAVINIGILLLALAIVVAALAWRTASRTGMDGEMVEAALALPPGAEVLSQSVSPQEIALDVRHAGGAREILVYARRDGRLVGRYRVATP